MDNQISSYSHGMAQRLAIIGAFINDPPVIFLDEPMVGLDAKSAYNLKQILRERAAAGKIVFSLSANIVGLLLSTIGINTTWQNPKELMQGGMRFFIYYIISFVVIIALVILTVVLMNASGGKVLVGIGVPFLLVIVLTVIFYGLAYKRYKKGFMDV